MNKEAPAILESSLDRHSGRQDEVTLKLRGVLNFDSVATLAGETAGLFRDYAVVVVDMTDISYVNSAGLALLLKLKQQADKSQKTVRITGVPEKLVAIARISELEKILF